MKSNSIFKKLLAISAFVLISTIVNAKNDKGDGNGQGWGNGNGNVPVPADQNNTHGRVNKGGNYNNGVNKDNHEQAPFDGGLSILAGAGLIYGFKRARDKRKRNTPSV